MIKILPYDLAEGQWTVVLINKASIYFELIMLMCTHPKTIGYLAWMEVQHSPSNLWSRRTWVSTWLVGSNSLHFAVLFGMILKSCCDWHRLTFMPLYNRFFRFSSRHPAKVKKFVPELCTQGERRVGNDLLLQSVYIYCNCILYTYNH